MSKTLRLGIANWIAAAARTGKPVTISSKMAAAIARELARLVEPTLPDQGHAS